MPTWHPRVYDATSDGIAHSGADGEGGDGDESSSGDLDQSELQDRMRRSMDCPFRWYHLLRRLQLQDEGPQGANRPEHYDSSCSCSAARWARLVCRTGDLQEERIAQMSGSDHHGRMPSSGSWYEVSSANYSRDTISSASHSWNASGGASGSYDAGSSEDYALPRMFIQPDWKKEPNWGLEEGDERAPEQTLQARIAHERLAPMPLSAEMPEGDPTWPWLEL